MRFVRRPGSGAWPRALLVSGVAIGFALGSPSALAAPQAADAARPVHSEVATGGVDAAAEYWTPERMANAIPVPAAEAAPGAQTDSAPVARGEPGQVPPTAPVDQQGSAVAGGGPGAGSTAERWTGSRSSAPAMTSGKVFFVNDQEINMVCSGSTVNSSGKNLVYTAGHCVHGGGSSRDWYAASKWMFVPAYDATSSNQRPYGTWTARQLWSLNGWTQNGDRRYDIGVAVMKTNSSDRHIVDVVGGQGIEWNYPLVQFVYQFGYPQRAPFDGATLQYCTGTTYDDDTNEGINCNMTEGASGGPWLDDFDGRFGRLDSVNSWVFWNSNGDRYKWNGPYFGEASRRLYAAVQNL
jgi:V8-like Glu-specific endopeptidase